MTDVLLANSISVSHNWPFNLDQDDIIDFEQEKDYLTYNSLLKEKGQVIVSPDSVIYKRGVLDIETTASPAHISYYRYRHFFKKRVFSKQINLPKGQAFLLATDLWSAGHFHWICDVLPRLWLLREQASQFSLLLPDVPYLRSIGVESFELLGIQFREIIWMKADSFYHVPELYFISPVQRSGHMHPVILGQLREQMLPDLVPGTKRMYISREKAAYRKIINESEFTGLLKQNGFDVFIGEDFTLRQQAHLFSQAHTLLGIHGAGLANAIFQHPGSNLVEIRRKENGPSNVGYWHIADALRHRFYYFNGEPDSPLPLVGRGCSLKIDLQAFERKVLQKLN